MSKLNTFYPVRYPLIEAFTHLVTVILNNIRQEGIVSHTVPSKRNWVWHVVFPIVVVIVV